MSEGEPARKRDGDGHRSHRERIGNYVVGAEIGRGSFATVYKGHRSVSAVAFGVSRFGPAPLCRAQAQTRPGGACHIVPSLHL